MTSARIRKKRQRRQQPSAPRMIGASNDNHQLGANDNDVVVNGITLNAAQARRFKVAVEHEASADPVLQRAGRIALLALERELGAAAYEAHRKAAEAETVALEEARGGVVETSDRKEHAGRKRITSRDGLETLLTAGSITQLQYAAGMRYRADYELLDPEKGLTPPALDRAAAAIHGGEGWAKKRAERERFVVDLERAIQAQDRTFKGALGRTDLERIGRAVWVIREIAGKGINLRHQTASGSTIHRLSGSLRLALDCAANRYSAA
ncbi:hypothetical protein [Brevundimonas sp. GCM10030266]|uniref:hypothetical protein n=1 Tax=Brevundimonas sp. GCM10030266 TaxID=3273386 RepID=UPI00360F3E1B